MLLLWRAVYKAVFLSNISAFIHDVFIHTLINHLIKNNICTWQDLCFFFPFVRSEEKYTWIKLKDPSSYGIPRRKNIPDYRKNPQIFWARALGENNWQGVICYPAVSSPRGLPWHQSTCGELRIFYYSLLTTEDEERNAWIVEATYFLHILYEISLMIWYRWLFC